MPLPQTTDTSVPRHLKAVCRNEESGSHVIEKIRVLIVNDDLRSAQTLADRLVQEGCLCEATSNGETALTAVRRHECDVVICDVRLRNGREFGLLEQVKALQPSLPVVIRTSVSSVVEAGKALKHGAFQYVEHSLNTSDLLRCIVQATVESHRYGMTPVLPPPNFDVVDDKLVQESAIMRELVETIALVARSSAPILILGESGTGKERVARAIHASGPRASQPFVAVNTSAIPEQLLESEVFGHVRGAFTGATQSRRGLLTEAHGGTLLLDEIGDMPILLQPKLLRVLQFGETRPVGSDRINHVDVRVIAATHRDLDALVRDGRFREDLRYRLNVIPLVVPPLRNRRQDIMPLVLQFLRDAKSRTPTSPVNSFGDEAVTLLTQAAWPGNVRELENAIERLVVLGCEEKVEATDLAFLQEKPPGEDWPAVEQAPWTLKEMKERYLHWVLARTKGDKVRAAGILDINLSTLYRWESAMR